MKVLLLDDHLAARLTFGAVLEQAGFEVVEAGTLAEARQVSATHALRAAVLDINVPDGVGTELIGELRSAHRGIVVAILSGSDDAARESPDLMLRKADSPTEQVTRLRRALEGARP